MIISHRAVAADSLCKQEHLQNVPPLLPWLSWSKKNHTDNLKKKEIKKLVQICLHSKLDFSGLNPKNGSSC